MKIDWEIVKWISLFFVKCTLAGFGVVFGLGTVIYFLPPWGLTIFWIVTMLGGIAFLMYKIMLNEKQWEARRVAYNKKYDGEIQERKKKAGERSIIV
jgi:hypothetical protein